MAPLHSACVRQSSSPFISERRRKAQEVANSFWKRLLDKYLPLLHERQKWLRLQRKIGHLILMVNENSSLGNWPFASKHYVPAVMRCARIREQRLLLIVVIVSAILCEHVVLLLILKPLLYR